jgi:hypothetical protein
MADRRAIALDATFTILYIAFAAAMAALSLLLLAMLALDFTYGAREIGAALLNLAGWALLPLLPRLYRRLLGHRFSWRANGALGGLVDA